MAAKITAILLVAVGLLHLYPAIGVVSGERLYRLYAVPLSDPNLLILMRHRAVLFGLLGLFLVYAAMRPALQPAAFIAGFLSMGSFILLAWLQGNYNTALAKVVWADAIGCTALAAAVAAYAVGRPAGTG